MPRVQLLITCVIFFQAGCCHSPAQPGNCGPACGPTCDNTQHSDCQACGGWLPKLSFQFSNDCGSECSHGQSCDTFGCQGDCNPYKYLTCDKYSPTCDKLTVKRTASRCARKALHRWRKQTRQRPSDDFSDGFHQAYQDLARGSAGATPPIPPPKYWNTHYRTAAGHQKAHQWFQGYEAGVSSARQDGAADFNRIAASTAFQNWQMDSAGGTNGVWIDSQGQTMHPSAYGGAAIPNQAAVNPVGQQTVSVGVRPAGR